MPKKGDDIKTVLKKHNILTIEQTAQLEKVKFFLKYFNNMLPNHSISSFSITIETAILVGHGRTLRYLLKFVQLNKLSNHLNTKVLCNGISFFINQKKQNL